MLIIIDTSKVHVAVTLDSGIEYLKLLPEFE